MPEGGFASPSFEMIAKAYGLEYGLVESIDDIENIESILLNKFSPVERE